MLKKEGEEIVNERREWTEQSPGSLFAFSLSLLCIYSSTFTVKEEEVE